MGLVQLGHLAFQSILQGFKLHFIIFLLSSLCFIYFLEWKQKEIKKLHLLCSSVLSLSEHLRHMWTGRNQPLWVVRLWKLTIGFLREGQGGWHKIKYIKSRNKRTVAVLATSVGLDNGKLKKKVCVQYIKSLPTNYSNNIIQYNWCVNDAPFSQSQFSDERK